MEKAEERFRDAERLLHQKDTSLVAMETELKHLNRNNNILESEKTHLKSQVDKINEELRSIRNTNTALEQRLSSEKSVVRFSPFILIYNFDAIFCLINPKWIFYSLVGTK